MRRYLCVAPLFNDTFTDLCAFLLHVPPMADGDRLARQRGRRKCRKKNRCLRDILRGREFTVDRILQKYLLNDIFFANAESFRLLGDLFIDQRRADEAGANYIGANTVFSALFGNGLR